MTWEVTKNQIAFSFKHHRARKNETVPTPELLQFTTKHTNKTKHSSFPSLVSGSIVTANTGCELAKALFLTCYKNPGVTLGFSKYKYPQKWLHKRLWILQTVFWKAKSFFNSTKWIAGPKLFSNIIFFHLIAVPYFTRSRIFYKAVLLLQFHYSGLTNGTRPAVLLRLIFML